MIDYNEARKIVIKAAAEKPAPVETLPLEECAGRIIAQDALAVTTNQPFDNAAMDGFALRAEDVAGATETSPESLKSVGRIAAGDKPPERAVCEGECFEIMTGAPLPKGACAVVPIEKTEQAGGFVRFFSPANHNDNIRRAGEDFETGAVLIEKGTSIGAHHILPLATGGIGSLEVYKSPRVGVISTGLEVVDDLARPLAPGQIYNSNGPYLRAALAEKGADIVPLGTVADDPDLYRKKLEYALDQGVDVIVSTGAVSAGAYDFVPAVLNEMGAQTLFHKVSIRPGKPNFFAQFAGGPVFFGLPGNPVAAAAGMRFFVYPFLRTLQGQEEEKPNRAVLANSYTKRKKDFTFFLKARSWHDEDGTQKVEILPGQESFKVEPFTGMNCWVLAPAGVELLEEGATVNIYPL